MKTPTSSSPSIDLGIEETRQFTIKASGKAFRTLISGIYADKVLAPARELMTNAYDSHIAAGKPSTPFLVHVPTSGVPEFRVRDYGVGMSHDQVMNGFSTLFESTKDQSNTEVGMLGLGSKSPFAYTDAFTLTCFDGYARRIYSAHLVDDIPSISLIANETYAAPTGVEVKFGVEVKDVDEFHDAIARVLLGFDVMPDMDNIVLPEREVKQSFDLFTIYKRDGWDHSDPLAAVNVRMGCVVYPVKNLSGTLFEHVHIDRNTAFVIDVPIGCTDVTTNREGLSEDQESRRGLRPHIDAAFNQFKTTAVARYDAAVTRLEKVEAILMVSREWREAFGFQVDPMLTLMPEDATQETLVDLIKMSPYHLRYAPQAQGPMAHAYRFKAEQREHMRFVLNDETAKRRMMRLREWFKSDRNRRYLIPDEATKQRLMSEIGIKPEQIIDFDDLYDPGPPMPSSSPRGASSQIGAKALKEALASKPWAQRMRKHHTVFSYEAGGIRRYDRDGFLGPFGRLVLGIPDDPAFASYRYMDDEATTLHMSKGVQYLTESQVAKLQPSPQTNVGVVLRRYWDENGFAQQVKDYLLATALRRHLRDEFISTAALTAAMKHAGYLTEMPPIVRDGLDIVMGNNETPFEPTGDEVEEHVALMKSTYPRLVAMTSGEITKYIEEM